MAGRWSAIIMAVSTLLVIGGTPSAAAAGSAVGPGAAGRPFRMAFSKAMFTEVNENDAKASMALWLKTVAQERGIFVEPESAIYDDIVGMQRALQYDPPDAIGVTADDYWQLDKTLKFDRLVVGVTRGRIDEEYVLLAHEDHAFLDVGGLSGRSLIILHTPA